MLCSVIRAAIQLDYYNEGSNCFPLTTNNLEEFSMSNPVMIFEIVGYEGKMLAEFYGAVFGWKIDEYEEGYYGIETGSETHKGIEGHIYPLNEEMDLVDNVPFNNNVTVYISVDDMQASMNKLESIGGKILMHPVLVSDKGEQMGMFLDPSGNRIGLYQK